MNQFVPRGCLSALFCILSAGSVCPLFAQSANPCVRYAIGSDITEPENLYSHLGVLKVQLSYRGGTDNNGNAVFCFVDQNGSQSPTLHVLPGDELILDLKNELAPVPPMVAKHAMPGMVLSASGASCGGSSVMSADSVNLHYHGTNVPPICHQDEVIRTIVNPGETYHYDVHFPSDEPPGLYWYHPHIHGISEPAVQGGATGAIIVEGLERVNPEVAQLPQRILLIRDNLVPGASNISDPNVPAWDLSLNYIPIPYPKYTPAVIPMKPSEKQLWRVANTSADTILDLVLRYDGQPQPLSVVALDGVPTNSQDGTGRGTSVIRKHLLLSPGARAEFVVTAPSLSVADASLATLNVDTGPDGDNDPERELALIKVSKNAPEAKLTMPAYSAPTGPARFAGLRNAKCDKERKLFFTEVLSDPSDPNSPTNFFITVDGSTPTLFSPDNPPAIVTTRGAVEDWVIENRALENHEFHIHQIHFLLLEQNGAPVSDGQYLDTVNVPYWSGTGPYPSVKLRMDFRGPTVGDFVYHCHILGHEDSGMMAIIRVNPR